MPGQLDDVEAIRSLLHRYADAVCRNHTDDWINTWHADGVWNVGRGPVVGADAIRTAFVTAMQLFEAAKQTLLNHEITVDGARGSGRAYMMEVGRAVSGRNVFYLGHYDDRYVFTPEDGWRFAQRTLHWHYQGPPDLTGTFGAPKGYTT